MVGNFLEKRKGPIVIFEFDNVPEGTLYRIENDQTRSISNVERIFQLPEWYNLLEVAR